MMKLPLLFFALLGTCAAQSQHPIAELQASSRVLIVFAPDASSPNFQRQLQLIERHSFELSVRNTVVVPVSTAKVVDDRFSFENLPVGTPSDQADARNRFHVGPGDFLVILLNQDGTEQIRSATPVDIHALTASLDSLPPVH
jgi:hypothetical protein